MPLMMTTNQACARLQVSHRTLRKWMERLQISSVRHEADPRYHMLREEDVERIRVARESMPEPSPRAPPYVPPTIVPPRAPAAPVMPIVPFEPLPTLPPLPAPLPRLRRATKHLRALSERPALPEGWMPLAAWGERHGVSLPAIKKAAHKGQIDVTYDAEGWSQGWGKGPTNWALSPEQQRSAHHNPNWARFGDPCRWCGYSASDGADSQEVRASVTERAGEHSRP